MKSYPHFKMKPIALALACGLVMNQNAWSAETVPPPPCEGKWKGIATVGGAIAGAWLGSQIGNDNGKLVAAAVGGVAGGLLGNYIGGEIDRRHCELERIAKANQISLDTAQLELSPPQESASPVTAEQKDSNAQNGVSESTGKVDVATLKGMEHFKSGSAELTPEAFAYFTEIAKQYDARIGAAAYVARQEQESAPKQPASTLSFGITTGQSQSSQGNAQQPSSSMSEKDKKALFQKVVDEQNQRPIVLIGHTDDTGNSRSNQILSEKRAKAVAMVFKKLGIPTARLFFRGAGEIEPVADNRSEEGRGKNRRVEIIELESKGKLENFVALKQGNTQYLRAKNPADVSDPVVETSPAQDSGKEIPAPTSAPALAQEAPKKGKKNGAGRSATTLAASPGGSPKEGVSVGQGGSPSTGKPIPEPDTSAQAGATGGDIDFGGDPFAGKMDAAIIKAMGKPVQPGKGMTATLSGWFVKEAQAADDHVYNIPCTADAPRYDGEYLSLDSGQAVKKIATSSYLPGLYQTSWTGSVNGNYVGITPVSVLRGSYKPASEPALLVYANTENPGANAKPTKRIPLTVNVYPGDKGVLYRMFAKSKSGFVCSDVVLPLKAPFTALEGNLYYKRTTNMYEANFVPAMLQ